MSEGIFNYFDQKYRVGFWYYYNKTLELVLDLKTRSCIKCKDFKFTKTHLYILCNYLIIIDLIVKSKNLFEQEYKIFHLPKGNFYEIRLIPELVLNSKNSCYVKNKYYSGNIIGKICNDYVKVENSVLTFADKKLKLKNYKKIEVGEDFICVLSVKLIIYNSKLEKILEIERVQNFILVENLIFVGKLVLKVEKNLVFTVYRYNDKIKSVSQTRNCVITDQGNLLIPYKFSLPEINKDLLLKYITGPVLLTVFKKKYQKIFIFSDIHQSSDGVAYYYNFIDNLKIMNKKMDLIFLIEDNIKNENIQNYPMNKVCKYTRKYYHPEFLGKTDLKCFPIDFRTRDFEDKNFWIANLTEEFIESGGKNFTLFLVDKIKNLTDLDYSESIYIKLLENLDSLIIEVVENNLIKLIKSYDCLRKNNYVLPYLCYNDLGVLCLIKMLKNPNIVIYAGIFHTTSYIEYFKKIDCKCKVYTPFSNLQRCIYIPEGIDNIRF